MNMNVARSAAPSLQTVSPINQSTDGAITEYGVDCMDDLLLKG